MKMMRYLLAIGLVCGLSGAAKADDFQMVVIDPVPSQFVTPVTSLDFTFSFSECHSPSQVPAGSGYVGCFTGENETGTTLTSLDMLIPVFSYQGLPQTAGCSLFGGGLDIFTTVTCGTTSDGKDYFLDFRGGSIPTAINDCDHDGDGGNESNGDDESCNAASIFTIAEAGVPPADFPEVQVIANAAAAPELNSFWLLSTGVLSSGLFYANWRRRTLCPTRS
jgi:hypothetical protein